MTASNYPKPILDLVLAEEGGYANLPGDRGGPTMKGITHWVYDRYRAAKGLPTRDVRQITDAELADIYRDDFWNKVRGDDLPSGVDLVTFDAGVNSGPSRAIKWLQRAATVTADGAFGPKTALAIRGSDPVALIRRASSYRLSFVQALSNWKRFGKGWAARIARKEAQGLKLYAESMPPVPVDIPAITEEAKRKASRSASGVATGGVSAGGAITLPQTHEWLSSPFVWAAIAIVVAGIVALGFRWYVHSTRAKALADISA